MHHRRIEVDHSRSGMRSPVIRSLPFRHNRTPELGFEVFRLSSLFARADRRAIDHELETPQRPEFHIVYLGITGRGHIDVDFAPVPVGKDLVTFVARGRVHSIPERGVDAWMLVFQPEFLAIAPGTSDPLVFPAVLSPLWSEPALALGRSDQRRLMSLVERLEDEHARPLDAIQPWLLSSLLRAFLLTAERIAGPRAAPPASLATFFTILERDHATTRSVAHYARASGVSVRRLAELVVAETGRSTKQVIDERVILEHKRLLAYTALSVKELADRTGFDEPTNLVKFFRRHTGQTPLEFRRNSPSARRS
jgi:AraC family transcriptional activator of pobA